MMPIFSVIYLQFLVIIPFHRINHATTHDLHLSQCKITWSEEGKLLDIRLHLWKDDLEKALGQYRTQTKDLPEKEEDILYAYLTSRLHIDVNQETLDIHWFGKEEPDDEAAVRVHLQARVSHDLRVIEVQNDVFMEIYNDQKNIVHIIGTKGRQGYLIFDKPGMQEKIAFE